ncbi:GIY-YIG nuclease family protein [Sphingomonas glacialis]|uniref:GIY-YIG nuclease family protein n=1 Tax=Sphingomonas glacialis TaxID=658225 RepID=A0A502G5V3_9SPHN|nr:GIY-YIG nuclease family protein [Sphingomonas glacialis]TPG56283.1 GIY-YIG nuclease family protein [Sphingomonas glacialis]
MRGGWIYIMSNRYRGTLYIGVTSHIAGRSFQHRDKTGSDFCRRYDLTRLVYADFAENIADAIAREKAMKKWRRAWKIELIERANPKWLDLFETLNGAAEEAAGFPLSRE